MRHKKIRFLYMFILGIIITLALNAFTPGRTIMDASLKDFAVSIFITLIVWEGNLRINRKVIVSINAIQKTGSYFNSRLKITTPMLQADYSIVSRERVNDFKEWLRQNPVFCSFRQGHIVAGKHR